MIEPRALKVETELALIGLLYEDNQRFKSPPPPTIKLSKRKKKKKICQRSELFTTFS
jgi:hypothetical protein